MKFWKTFLTTVICVIIFINGIATYTNSNDTEDTHIELLSNGSKTISSSETKPNISTTCLSNEYGPNCTFCIQHDTCKDGHYTCDKITGSKQCLPGWRGATCQDVDGPEVDEYHVTCPESQCRNGGECVSGRCCCGPGFTGILCEVEIIECANDSCMNGGMCTDLVGSFKCICKPNYGGERCEKLIDNGPQTTTSRDTNCQRDTCKNNGRCYEDSYYVYCLCPTGFTGEHCETNLVPQSSVNQTCKAHYYGEKCDTICIPTDSCHGGHFVCHPLNGSKICIEGWIGSNCDTRLLPQHLDPLCPQNLRCKNDGQCFHNECCCKHNYTGQICNIESIGCLSNPCYNNATCYPSGNGYRCECSGNFTGRQCETILPTLSSAISTSIKPSPTLSLIPSTSSTAMDTSIEPSPTLSSKLQSSFPSIEQPSLSVESSQISILTSTNSLLKETMTVSPYSSEHLTSSDIIVSPTLTTLPSQHQINFSQLDHIHSHLATQLESSFASASGILSTDSTLPSERTIAPSIATTMPQNVHITPTGSNQNMLMSKSSTYTSASGQTPSISSVIGTSVTSSSATPSSSLTNAKTSSSTPISKSSLISSASISPSTTSPTERTSSQSNFVSSFSAVSNTISSSPTSVLKASNSQVTKTNTVMSHPITQALNSDISTAGNLHSMPASQFSSNTLTPSPVVLSPTQTPGSASVPSTLSLHVFPTPSAPTTGVRANGTDDIPKEDHTDSKDSVSWWIILLIVAGVLFVLIVLLVIVLTRIRQRRRDSRTLKRKPELIEKYDKEHFSAQPDFTNPGYDIKEDDSDDDTVKHDIYVVNE